MDRATWIRIETAKLLASRLAVAICGTSSTDEELAKVAYEQLKSAAERSEARWESLPPSKRGGART